MEVAADYQRIERLHKEFMRRGKAKFALPNGGTAARLSRALMASGQITMGKADGWQSLEQAPVEQLLDLAA